MVVRLYYHIVILYYEIVQLFYLWTQNVITISRIRRSG